MIILSIYQWDVGVGGSWVVGVLVVDSFEFCSTYFSNTKAYCRSQTLLLIFKNVLQLSILIKITKYFNISLFQTCMGMIKHGRCSLSFQ